MYYSIIGFDIEEYSKDNDAILLKKKRSDLELIIKESAMQSGFDRLLDMRTAIADAGDGFYALIDSRDFGTIIRFLDQVSHVAKVLNSIRIRGVLHQGDCEKTRSFLAVDSEEENVAGRGINEASRYLNCDPLRQLLKIEIGSNFVYGISREVYNEIQEQSFFNRSLFNEYAFIVKQFNSSIYLKTNKEKIDGKEKVAELGSLKIKEEFSDKLNSCVLNDLYSSKGKTSSAMYVFPELMKDFTDKLGTETISSEEYFKKYTLFPKNLIISGDEQIGKTSLCKEIFKLFYETKVLMPVYLDLKESYSGNLKNKIEQAINEQYLEKVADYDKYKKIIITDNFHLVGAKYQRKILEEATSIINSFFIFTVDSVFNVNLLEREIDQDYESLTIKEFGPSLRHELILKWMESEGIEDNNYRTIDSLMDYVSNTLLKGLVPSIPINILIILEEKKTFNPLKSEISSKGHCYQALIYIALRKAEISDSEIDIFLNFFEHLAYHFYESLKSGLVDEEFDAFYKSYESEYNQPITKKRFIEKLLNSKIVKYSSIGEYIFSCEYIFFFFVSKYLADHYRDNSVYKKVESIYNNLQHAHNGYIGVFLIHHLRDEKVLDEIEVNLLVQYDKYNEATMDGDEIEFLQKHIHAMSKLSLDTRNHSYENRQKALKYEDSKEVFEEREEREEENDVEATDSNFDLIAELRELRKALRTVEVMGQILKTRTGSFKREVQKRYFKEAVKVYLRITKRFMDDFEEYEGQFIEYFKERIEGFNIEKLTTEDMYNLAKRYFFNVIILNYFSCVKRSAVTLCSDQILQVVSEVCEEINTTLSYFIKLQCDMWYRKRIPIEEIKQKNKEMKDFQKTFLARLVIYYCEMHDVHIRDKQKIANALGLKLERLHKSKEAIKLI